MTAPAAARVLLTRRETRIKPPWRALRRVLLEILKAHDVRGDLSVVFVDDAEIARLHGEFMDDDRPTDVISFCLDAGDEGWPEEEARPFGEVVVSAETAAREAERRSVPMAREAALYAIHGTLHLVGFDDLDPASKRAMRRQEKKYLTLYQDWGGA